MRLFIILCLSVLTAMPALAALQPTVSTTQIRDFTRITFDWPQKIRFRAQETPSGVILTFSEPTRIDLEGIRRQLGPTLRSSQSSKDGASITLTFDRPYRIRHFISGNANGIDILGASPTARPAPTAAPARAAATPAPTVTAPAPAVAAPAAAPPPAVPKPQAAAAQPVPFSRAAPPPAPQRDTVKAAPSPAVEKELLPQTPATAPLAREQKPAEPAPALPQAEPAAKAPALPEKQVEKPAAAITPPAAAAATATPQPVKPAPAPAAPPSADPFAALVQSETVKPPLKTQVTPPVAAAPKASDPKANEPMVVTVNALSSGSEIRFPWTERTAAAVFFRDKTLWMVFNAKRRINLAMLQSILPASVTAIEQVEHPDHTILRFTTDGTLFARIGQPKGTVEWWVTLSQYQQVPSQPVTPDFRTGARLPHVHLPVLEYAQPVVIPDPLTGDEITVMPFFKTGEGFYPGRRFVEMELLASAQGLAVIRTADAARVVPLRNGIRLTARETGLSLSSNLPQLALEELQSLSRDLVWFPYDNWKAETLLEARREIEQQLPGAAPLRANSLRLKLAQAYFAEGLAYETLGLLAMIKAQDPVFYSERRLAALEGAANFLIDRYPEAIALFKDESLRDTKELKVWQEALSVLQQDRPRFDYLDHYREFISKYPPALREKLAILAADNYINRKSFTKALKTFDSLSEGGVAERTIPYIDFLLGKISAENEDYASAKTIWQPLAAQMKDRFIRARAEFALTTMQYTNNEIDAEEAIDRLDRLRIVWRGDSLELSLLNYLGQLYIDNGEYLQGLRAWRELVNNFPDSPLAGPVAREMAKTFNFLYTEGGADTLEPLEALAAFYEFRELTPIGDAGDKMIQGLADRLASVDLLDRAAALLEHQIKFRQEGESRSMMGAQLALIYLLNREADKAVAILELTNYGENPPSLARKRTLLGAMALSETGESERALEMLSSDISREADGLRLNIYWRMREWNRVIAVAESLLGARADVSAPLEREETEQLLQLAIAYMFERNSIQLQYLRNYFSPLLAEGPNKDIFLFVTDASGPIDPYRFDQVSQQISRIESFMQTYRDRVAEGGLSAVVN